MNYCTDCLRRSGSYAKAVECDGSCRHLGTEADEIEAGRVTVLIPEGVELQSKELSPGYFVLTYPTTVAPTVEPTEAGVFVVFDWRERL